jgi:hypothetical protein
LISVTFAGYEGSCFPFANRDWLDFTGLFELHREIGRPLITADFSKGSGEVSARSHSSGDRPDWQNFKNAISVFAMKGCDESSARHLHRLCHGGDFDTWFMLDENRRGLTSMPLEESDGTGEFMMHRSAGCTIWYVFDYSRQ